MQQRSTDLAAFLHAIADPVRRRILESLKYKDKGGDAKLNSAGMCAGDIEDCVKLSQPTVSHHMKILEKAGLVDVRKEGTWRRYRRNERLIRTMTQELKRNI